MGKKKEAAPSGQLAWIFSPNPDKAWAELFFLQYSLVWPSRWCGASLRFGTN